MAPRRPGAVILSFPPRRAREDGEDCHDAAAGPEPNGRGRDGREPSGWEPNDQGPGDRGLGGRRFLSLDLPRLAIERRLCLAGLKEDALLALAVPGPHGPVLHAATRAALAAGAVPGRRVVDVRSACPDLRVEDADPAGDAVALDRLVLWARRWCPWTAADGSDAGPGGGSGAIVMDVTGSTHLWNGEAALLGEVQERLVALGLSARLAVAPTRGAAWALARFAGPRALCALGEVGAMTGPLPVRALRLGPATALLLRRLGLKTVGDLQAVPRLSLDRRFARAEPGENPLLRLDQLLGRLPEPLRCPDEPPCFLAHAALSEPVEDPGPLLPPLARELCAMLDQKGMGARRVRLSAFRSDGVVSFVDAATARATRDPLHLTRLFEGRLERLDPGFGFDLVTLGALVAEPMPPRQAGLDGAADHGEDLARLLDRLGARFGPRALRRPAFRESHVPERAEVLVPALSCGAPPLPPPGTLRPLRLFEPPEEVRVVYAVPEGPPAQFTWRRVTHRVARWAGPERISPEWWRDKPGTRLRDYYRVEDVDGRRFWLYREGVAGDGRGESPRWFVHGVFG